MSEGIRATIEFSSSVPCEIAAASRETDSIIDGIWTSVATADSRPSVSEFLVEADEPPALDSAAHVLTLGGQHLFRYRHGERPTCPCERLGRTGCAVQRYVAEYGSLRLVFNAANFDELQAAVVDLQDRFPDLDVRRLIRSPDPERTLDAVFVDRGRLTDRQREVLRTAYRMGYFERPREANATDVAAELGIDQSTFNEHLVSAQRKILGDLFEEGP